jgi:hypothetical protein
VDLLIYASAVHPELDLFPTGEVDQFQVPRIHTPRLLQQAPDMDMNHHQFNHTRIPEPQEPQQPPLPMTPQIHDTVPQQHSPIDSPIYGQTADLPHYELMIVNALNAISDPNGSPPKVIWDWMNRYTL